ncbi:DUF4065 domain-containing protein [Candidatus Peregrinibacteria bacterium]|nr:DUF4065 domain-containing protein [Candidatus Peregrinibacteria bacterium]
MKEQKIYYYQSTTDNKQNMPSKNHPHQAALIAEYFLSKAKEENKPISNKKLQKLLYYAQAWHLALYGEKLFKEDIEAWIHGPAVRKIYTLYKKFGFAPITINKIPTEKLNKLQKKQINLLEEIWKIYGKYDADYLEQLSHSEPPWQKAREGLDSTMSSKNIISDEEMKKYYKNLYKTHSKK